MEIKDNKVTFEISEKDLNILKLSLAILDKDPDEFFKDCIDRLSYIALRSNKNYYPSAGSPIIRESTDSIERAKRRIENWGNNVNYVNYNIIKAYLIAQRDANGEPVKRETMIKLYADMKFKHEGRNNEVTFLRNFRMLCSDSAYGYIFKYCQADDTVTVVKSLEDFLAEHSYLYLDK